MATDHKELQLSPLFAGLEPEQLARVYAIGRTIEAGRRQVLFREGEPVEGMFVLLSGGVKIYKLSPDGKQHILHIVRPGQAFAEAAIFMARGYPAYAEALQKSKVFLLPKNPFLALLREEPDVSLNIIATLSRYLKMFADRIEDLSLKDVSARLARWLLQSADDRGRDFWELDMTKGELASQLGTVSETLSRTLRKFKEADWIQVRGRFMKILDRNALQEVAEMGEESSSF
ncbi:MAG: Crp/Fnr family transcriptional regulator [Deltaproteobacteria bacterium]|nr:Crp/Fnr family transcriptional regulator [Deltaproteobacteria bacterium]